jgi:hypothetical protein
MYSNKFQACKQMFLTSLIQFQLILMQNKLTKPLSLEALTEKWAQTTQISGCTSKNIWQSSKVSAMHLGSIIQSRNMPFRNFLHLNLKTNRPWWILPTFLVIHQYLSWSVNKYLLTTTLRHFLGSHERNNKVIAYGKWSMQYTSWHKKSNLELYPHYLNFRI